MFGMFNGQYQSSCHRKARSIRGPRCTSSRMLRKPVSRRDPSKVTCRLLHTSRTDSKCPARRRTHAHDLRPGASEALGCERTGKSAPCDCYGGHCVRSGDVYVCLCVRKKESLAAVAMSIENESNRLHVAAERASLGWYCLLRRANA